MTKPGLGKVKCDVGANVNMQAFGLSKESAEQQNAKDHNDSDDDDLDETHSDFLRVSTGEQ